MTTPNKLDAVADITRDILLATEENLRTIPVIGLVKNTPLAKINNQLNSVRDTMLKQTHNLIGEIGTVLNVSVDELQVETTKNIVGLTNEFRLKNVDSLRKDLFRATQNGINKQPKIVTKSGRKFDYKAYMEMNIRTTLAHELKDLQLEYGGEAGVVFYLCNVFEDSADDHAPFQGKYYYDERFKTFGYNKETISEITKVIRDKKIAPLQYVQNNKPFLGTRPNCRHTFSPVSLEQVIKIAPTKLSKDLGTTTGTYKDAKYVNTQKLRSIELAVRNYRYKYEINKTLRDSTIDVNLKEQFNKVAQRNRKLATKWRERRKALVKKHDYLKADIRREDRNIILNDLGVTYRKDVLVVYNTLEYKKATLSTEDFEKYLTSESNRLEFDIRSLL